MKKRIRWNQVADAMQLHGEPLPGVSLVEIAGDCRVLIEYHKGVIKYDRQQICIKTTYGHVVVCGCNLTLMEMTRTQLIITGRIRAIEFKRRDI